MTRLVVVSNRVSVPRATQQAQAGGLAVALEGALKEYGGIWFGWDGNIVDNPPDAPAQTRRGNVTYAVTLRIWDVERGRYEHELHVDVPTEHVAFEPGGAIVGWLSTEMIVDWDELDEDEEADVVPALGAEGELDLAAVPRGAVDRIEEVELRLRPRARELAQAPERHAHLAHVERHVRAVVLEAALLGDLHGRAAPALALLLLFLLLLLRHRRGLGHGLLAPNDEIAQHGVAEAERADELVERFAAGAEAHQQGGHVFGHGLAAHHQAHHVLGLLAGQRVALSDNFDVLLHRFECRFLSCEMSSGEGENQFANRTLPLAMSFSQLAMSFGPAPVITLSG